MTSPSPDAKVHRDAFTADLVAALEASPLTLEQVARRLADAGTPVSITTLSYWSNGRSSPGRGRSLKALGTLEEVLGLPQGTLSRHFDAGEDAAWRAYEVIGAVEEVEQVLARWGMDLERRVVSLSVQETTRVHADGRTSTSIVRQVVQVVADSVTTLPLIFADAQPHRVPSLAMHHGGTIGRIHEEPSESRLVAELVLPRRFERGECTWFEYEVVWAPTQEPLEGSNERRLPLLTGLLTLDVVFEGEVPRYFEHRSTPVDGSRGTRAPLVPVDKMVQVVHANAAPGIYEIRWSRTQEGLHWDEQ